MSQCSLGSSFPFRANPNSRQASIGASKALDWRLYGCHSDYEAVAIRITSRVWEGMEYGGRSTEPGTGRNTPASLAFLRCWRLEKHRPRFHEIEVLVRCLTNELGHPPPGGNLAVRTARTVRQIFDFGRCRQQGREVPALEQQIATNPGLKGNGSQGSI